MKRSHAATVRGWRRWGGALTALAAITITSVYAVSVHAENVLPDPGWSVSAAPASNLVDGQRVILTVKARSNVSVSQIEIRQCRLGPTYASDDDTSPQGGNCPRTGVSSSADHFVQRTPTQGLSQLSQSDAGDAIPFFVGEGTTGWTDNTGANYTLTCDPTNPCALVAKVYVGTNDPVWQVIRLDFAESDPLAACGGPAPGVLSTAGADEVSDMWAQWTRAECAATGKGAPGRAAFTGEGAAVSSFAQGDLDLAYTAAGYDDAVGLSTIAPADRRAAIAVPLALGAEVVGVTGGEHQLVDGSPVGDKAPYPDGSVALSASEVAAMVGGGVFWLERLDQPYRGNILARNPALFGNLIATDAAISAPSQTLSGTYFLTNYLHTLAPADFVDPSVLPNPVHGPTASFPLANPPFNNIGFFTGRPALAKSVIPLSLSASDGPGYAILDIAGARALGVTPAALQSGSGFVAPTAESMDAAVALMKPDPNGMLLPDPSMAQSAAVSATATAPYPLTYVEYALVPAEPLVDTDNCTPRSDSQALLMQWLGYATGAGQQNLPAGMQPLPPALVAQAKAALPNVGASPVTGKCAGQVTAPAGTGALGGAGGLGALGSGGLGAGLSNGSVPSFTGLKLAAGGIAAGVASGAASGDGAGATNGKDAVAVPAFAGHKVPNALGGVVALLGIVLLTTLGAWITAGGEIGGGIRPGGPEALTPRRIGSLALLWTAVGVTGIGLVMFQLGPMLEQRDQQSLLHDYKAQVRQASNEAGTLTGIKTAAEPPEVGAPVAILEIGAIESQDVVVEGVTSSQTREGPGHVPGTSGLGQPGNSVVVARRNGYGGSFGEIGKLRPGDRIVATTTQGQSVYSVSSVCALSVDTTTANLASSTSSTSAASVTGDFCPKVKLASTARTGSTTTTMPRSTSTLSTPTSSSAAPSTTAAGSVASSSHEASATPVHETPKTIKVDTLYGPTQHDQLTLVTSAKRLPWNSNDGTLVVAKLLGKPFAPTPQGARSSNQTGLAGDSSAWPTVILCLLGFAGVITASVLLYRKLRFRVAYILTIAPLVAFTVITGEALIRLLPAWS